MKTRFGVLLYLCLAACSSEPATEPSPVDAGADVANDDADAPPLAARVTGRVVLDGVDDRSGITVLLVGGAATKTATDGSFSFDDVKPGSVALLVEAPWTDERTHIASIEARAGETADVGTIAFTAVGDLTGRALFASGVPAPSVAVSVVGAPGVALSGPDGRFVLSRVRSGSRTVLASFGATDSGTATATVPYGRAFDMGDLTLTPIPRGKGAVTGVARLTGETSSAGVVVSLIGPSSASAVTDASGAFGFDKLADGGYTISLAAPSTLEGARTVTATLSGAGVDVGELAFTPYGRVEGKVRLAGATTGNAGIVVSLGGTAGTAITADDGSYAIDRVPTGPHTIVATKSGYVSASASTPSVLYAKSVTVPMLDLKYDPATTITIAGRATLPLATSHAGTTITVAGTGRSGMTSADGTFSVDGIPAGGIFTLDLVNGAFADRVPDVLGLSGGKTLILENGIAMPLPELELVRGTRTASLGAYQDVWFAPRNGTHAVFRRAGGIDVIELATGKVINVAAIDKGSAGYVYGATFTPNGQYAVLSGSGGPWVVQLSSGKGVRLSASYPWTFSRDSSKFAWPGGVYDFASGYTLPVTDAGGNSSKLSRNGSHYARSKSVSGGNSLVTVTRVYDGVDFAVTCLAGLDSYGFTGDGRYFVYVTPDGSINVRDLQTDGEPTTVITGTAREVLLAPEGAWFVSVSNTGAYRVHQGTVAGADQPGPARFAFSSIDGRPMIGTGDYYNPRRFRLFDSPTTTKLDLSSGADVTGLTRMTRDGTKILTTAQGAAGLVIVDVATGAVTKIDPSFYDPNTSAYPQPAIVGNRVVYVTSTSPASTKIAALDGSGAVKLADAVRDLWQSPDGSRVVLPIEEVGYMGAMTTRLVAVDASSPTLILLARQTSGLAWNDLGLFGRRGRTDEPGTQYRLAVYRLAVP